MISSESNSHRANRWFTILLAILAIVGCSDGRPERVPVSGTVLINGQPLASGNIKFVPKNGRPSASKIDEQGHFNLTCYDGNDGALLGTHQVQVSSNRIISDSKIEWYAPREYADFRYIRNRSRSHEANRGLGD